MNELREPKTPPAVSRWEASGRTICIVLSSIACIFCIWILIGRVAFNGFSYWDDEGYFILLLRQFLHRGGLYVNTFSQYGPLFTLVESSLHRLFHIPVDLDGARILTVSYILGSAVLLSAFVGRLTRRLSLSLSCFVLSVIITAPILKEPGHPQGLIAFLMGIAVCLSLLVGRRYENLGLALLGAVAAALALTKINVGLFFCFALIFPLLLLLVKGRLRSMLLAVFVVGSLCVPPLLMSAYLRGWAASFCWYMLISFAALYVGAFQSGAPKVMRLKLVTYPVLGFAATAIPILAWAVWTGSTPASLVSGILIRPLGHPRLFYIAGSIPPWGLIALLLPVVCLSLVPLARRRFAQFELGLAATKVALSLIAGAFYLWAPDLPMFYTLPLLPVLLIRSHSDSDSLGQIFPRLFLVSLVEFEMLQSYPVLATSHHDALTVSGAWVSLLLFDGWSALVALGPAAARTSALMRRQVTFGWLCFALTAPVFSWYVYTAPTQLGNIVLHHWQVAARLLRGQPFPPRYPRLDLPGARLVRVPATEAPVYRRLAQKLHDNCDMVFTMPGMGSLNVWSETPPPNGFNLPAWMWGFTAQEQEAILFRLERAERPCVVYSPAVLGFYIRPEIHLDPKAPMVEYVLEKTKTVFTAAGYEIRVPYGRQASFTH